MANLDEFIKGIIDGEIKPEAAHTAEIDSLIKANDTEAEQIEGMYTKIGK